MELELDPIFGQEARNTWLDKNKEDLGDYYEEDSQNAEQINNFYQTQLTEAIQNVFSNDVEQYVWCIEDGACGACESMEGEIFEFEQPQMLSISVHNNCRCMLQLMDNPEIKTQASELVNLLQLYQWEDGAISLEAIHKLLYMAGLTLKDGELADIMKAVHSAYKAAGNLKDYLKKSLDQVIFGNYTDNVTALGTAGQIALGLTGLDVAADIRDLTHDLSNWEWTWGHAGKTLLDGIGLVPVVGALKNADEVAALIKNSDEVLQDAGATTGKFIDNTMDAMTSAEKQVVDDLVGQGRTVERIPRSDVKTPDFKVDGVSTELKTLQNPNTNTGMKHIREGFKQGAETVIVDARGSGLTKELADEVVSRARGIYPDKSLPGEVEIWLDDQIITYPQSILGRRNNGKNGL